MVQSNEILLTLDEIKAIQEFVSLNPELADPNLFNIGSKPTSIVKVSPKTGLIIVEGNEFTGFKHIHMRHEYHSSVPYWIVVDTENGKQKKLQDQSRFRPDSIPFWDYINIADSIYKPENLNVEKNNRVELFDLYLGNHTNKDGTVDAYKLLVYKDSKVVHTFYPQRTKYNRKRVKNFPFARGAVKGQIQYPEELVEITVPYKNEKSETKYSILVRKYLPIKKEQLFILIHNASGEAESFVYIGERDCNKFNAVPFETMIWQHADLWNFEEHIKAIHEDINNCR